MRDKKEPKSASADGCPAELATRLQHFAQTAAGNLIFYLEHARRLRARGVVALCFLNDAFTADVMSVIGQKRSLMHFQQTRANAGQFTGIGRSLRTMRSFLLLYCTYS